MPSPEEAQSAMAVLSKLQHDYENGEIGLPPGAEWVDTAMAYLEHAGTYGDEAAVRAILDGYQILMPPPPPPPTFREAMDIPDWWQGFVQFSQTEHNEENPGFIDALRSGWDPRQIFDTYVQPEVINLPGAVRGALVAAFADPAATPDISVFDAAKEEIIRLCAADSWKRYLASMAG